MRIFFVLLRYAIDAAIKKKVRFMLPTEIMNQRNENNFCILSWKRTQNKEKIN